MHILFIFFSLRRKVFTSSWAKRFLGFLMVFSGSPFPQPAIPAVLVLLRSVQGLVTPLISWIHRLCHGARYITCPPLPVRTPIYLHQFDNFFQCLVTPNTRFFNRACNFNGTL